MSNISNIFRSRQINVRRESESHSGTQTVFYMEVSIYNQEKQLYKTTRKSLMKLNSLDIESFRKACYSKFYIVCEKPHFR